MRWPKSLPLSLANFHDERVKLAPPSLSIFFSLWPSSSIHDSSLFAYHHSSKGLIINRLDIIDLMILARIKNMVASGSQFYHPFNMGGFVRRSFWNDTTFFLQPSTSIHDSSLFAYHHSSKGLIINRLDVIDSILLARIKNIIAPGSQFYLPFNMGAFRMTLLSSSGHQHLSMIHYCLRATIFLRVKESLDLGVIDSII